MTKLEEKYIRTKDNNIFKLYSETDKEGSFKVYHPLNWLEYGYVSCEEVVKQADTIEELCDEFVWKAPNNIPLIVPNIYNMNIEKEIKNVLLKIIKSLRKH